MSSTDAKIAYSSLTEFVAGAERYLDPVELARFIASAPAPTERDVCVIAMLAVLLSHLTESRSTTDDQ